MALKLFYACAYSVYGVILPFLPLILRSRGLSDSDLSLALSAIGIAGILPPLLFAHLSDRVLSFQRLAPPMLAAGALTPPFWLLTDSIGGAFLVTLGFFSLYLPLLTLIDAYTLAFMQESAAQSSDRPHFKSFRIWGSIGFIIPAMLLPLIGFYSQIGVPQLIALAAVLGVIAAVVSRQLPPTGAPLRLPSLPSVDALHLALQKPLRNFFIGAFFVGVPVSIFYILFPLYLQELGFSNTSLAWIINLGVIAEIFMIFAMQRLIKRIGIENLIMLGVTATVLRLVLMGTLSSTAVVIVSQVLHAPLVTGFFVAIPIYLQERAAPSFRFSLQGLYVALIFGVSRTIGPLLLAGLFAVMPGGAFARIQWCSLVSGAIMTVGAIIMRRGLRHPRHP